jgi:hypothetical protein
MIESKIDLTHRLQHEGRWSEASNFKDERIASHRSHGKTRVEAQQTAWDEMEEKFPAPVKADESLDSEAIPAAWSENAAVDFHGDAMWVYSNLACGDVEPEDAPSAGAWSLLEWARTNRDRFFEQMVPKVVGKQPPKRLEDMDELEEPYLDDMANIKTALADMHANMEYGFIKNTHETVKQEVKAITSDWQRQFGLDLPREAFESFERQMIHVADQLIQVVAKDPTAFVHD